MGGGVSVAHDDLNEDQKRAVTSHLKTEYASMSAEAGRRPSLQDADIFKHLKSEYNKAVSSAKEGDVMDASRSPKGAATGGGVAKAEASRARGGSDSDDDQPMAPNASDAAAIKALADQNKGFFGSAPLPSGGAVNPNDGTFRRRRLTFATQGNITPHTPLHQIQQRVFRSLEIGDVPKVPLPFPDTVVGTYSCHGIEPSYMDSKPFVAKINQDRGVVVHPFAGNDKMAIFAVFDGHGEVGDKVSEFCMYEVPKVLEAHPKLLAGDVVGAFKETFLTVDQRLAMQPNIEAFYSGTTAVVAMVKDSRIYVANAGDSRCTMATMKNGKLVAQDLSIDQNPDSPAEMDRITKLGGFVSPPPEPGLSARVWLDPDFTQVGLAMARSIGDRAVKGVGVIAEPEVLMHDFTSDDKFLIFASDGVWEFISSAEAVGIINDNLSKGPAFACQVLIENAAARWRDMEGDYRDDITALVIRLPIFA